MPRRTSEQNYASLCSRLHKGLLKGSPLCKLCPSRVTNKAQGDASTPALHIHSVALCARLQAYSAAALGRGGQIFPYLQQPPVRRRLFLLLSPSLRQPALSRTPPGPPALLRAGYGCAVSSHPSPAPRPQAPLRPASRAGSRPPTSGYRLQPPRFWHYGHGGGDGSAEAEQAGHQGSGFL